MTKFIMIICNGNFSLVQKTVSNELTWFEEWFLFLKLDSSRHTHVGQMHVPFLLENKPIKVRKVFDAKAYLIPAC